MEALGDLGDSQGGLHRPAGANKDVLTKAYTLSSLKLTG